MIQESVLKVGDAVAEITAAGHEQATGIEQVNQAINRLDSMNQENSALVEETAAATEDLNRQAEGLTSLMEFFTLDSNQESSHGGGTEISLIFTKARNAHQAWKGKIRGFLSGAIEMDENQAVSHHDCVLGQWLDAEGREQYRHLEEMQELDLVHERMHGVIREILQIKHAGQHQEAEALAEQIAPLSDRVISLLDEIERRASQGATTPAVPMLPHTG